MASGIIRTILIYESMDEQSGWGCIAFTHRGSLGVENTVDTIGDAIYHTILEEYYNISDCCNAWRYSSDHRCDDCGKTAERLRINKENVRTDIEKIVLCPRSS